MMKTRLINKGWNKGLTLIEMAVVLTIISLGGLGLVSSAISIVGYYQDDFVLKDIRRYGSTALEVISQKLQTAKTISASSGPNGYDLIRLKYNDDDRTYSIQATETEGFLWQGQPLMPYMPLQVDGSYRLNGQREIFLESFDVDNLIDAEYNPIQNRPRLAPVAKSVYEISIVFGLSTWYEGEENAVTEYVTFRKKVYAYQNLIHRI
ncbi:prepilin-type N-terminal cleavage/methylation domain-containing protein [bacterium]|nr:prepilin-type N-terminal cleavage/methylation domain-containing protein [bacterium]